MNDVSGGVGGWPVDDDDAEALLTGTRTDRGELASLERFLQEVRVPRNAPIPRPSDELARLFSEGPADGVFGTAPAGPATAPRAAAGGRVGRETGRVEPGGRKQVRTMAKVAVVTTTAALAVTLAAAAQVPGTAQVKQIIGISRPATPVPLGSGPTIVPGTSEVKVGAEARAGIQQPPTSAVGRTTVTRSAVEADRDAMSGDDLARLPFDVLKTLSGDQLARLPLDVLRTLPGDALGRLPAELLRTLPGDALGRLSTDILKTLPGDVLARLSVDVLRALPTDVQGRLPADLLRLLLLTPPPGATTSTVPARP